MISLLNGLSLKLKTDMKHQWDSRFLVVHLRNKVSEVFLVLNLWILEKIIVQRSDQDQHLAPVDVRGVSNLLNTFLSLSVQKLFGHIKILFIETLHNVCPK